MQILKSLNNIVSFSNLTIANNYYLLLSYDILTFVIITYLETAWQLLIAF